MATLRPCVQKQRSDGFYPVYIRVIHNRESAFIKTDKLVDKKSVSKTREIREIGRASCRERVSSPV